MKTIVLISFCLFFVGCSDQPKRLFDTSDSEFDLYVDQFKSDFLRVTGHKIVIDTVINFSDNLSDDFNGACLMYPNGKNEILISKKKWVWAPEVNRKSLIYHELGHCELGQLHRNYKASYKGFEIKGSLMNTHSRNILFENEPELNEIYLHELFYNDQSVWK